MPAAHLPPGSKVTVHPPDSPHPSYFPLLSASSRRPLNQTCHPNNRILYSQPIKVDGRSLVDLKAVVYAKEQKVKLDGGGSSAGLRGLRGKRAAAGSHADGPARKDPFARSNRGVEDRSQRDELDRVTASQKRKAAQRTMAAKASLYEKMGERFFEGGGVAGGEKRESLDRDDFQQLQKTSGKYKIQLL